MISGRGARGARGAGPALTTLLDRLGAAYLDTGDSRGLVPDTHPSFVGAMRGAVFGDADIVLTVGRRLDFQLAYGSPAVFGNARFVRIGDVPGELRDNRRGEVEILASCEATLRALVGAAGNRTSEVDPDWAGKLRDGHTARALKLRQTMAAAPPGNDGKLHPNRVLAGLQEALDPGAIAIVDGGDRARGDGGGIGTRDRPRARQSPRAAGCCRDDRGGLVRREDGARLGAGSTTARRLGRRGATMARRAGRRGLIVTRRGTWPTAARPTAPRERSWLGPGRSFAVRPETG